MVTTLSVHDYKCHESTWRDYFEKDSVYEENFFNKLKEHLGEYGGKDDQGVEYGGKEDWGIYVDSLILWVTETNCNNDLDADDHGTASEEACMRITG